MMGSGGLSNFGWSEDGNEPSADAPKAIAVRPSLPGFDRPYDRARVLAMGLEVSNEAYQAHHSTHDVCLEWAVEKKALAPRGVRTRGGLADVRSEGASDR